MSDNVLDNIVGATAARRRSRVNTRMERFSANQSHRVLYLEDGQFQFLPSAFEVPLFHADAPSAANYGALGSEITNAFSALLYWELRNSDNETLAAFAEKATCLSDAVSPTDSSGSQVLQRAASVRVLHKAFRHASSRAASQPRLEDLQHLSDVQLLFVMWCYSQCSRHGAQHLCNEPVARFRAFAEAFSCSAGSRRECAFLE